MSPRIIRAAFVGEKIYYSIQHHRVNTRNAREVIACFHILLSCIELATNDLKRDYCFMVFVYRHHRVIFTKVELSHSTVRGQWAGITRSILDAKLHRQITHPRESSVILFNSIFIQITIIFLPSTKFLFSQCNIMFLHWGIHLH